MAVQRPARTDELDTRSRGGVHELLGEPLMIHPIRHYLDRLGQDWSLP